MRSAGQHTAACLLVTASDPSLLMRALLLANIRQLLQVLHLLLMPFQIPCTHPAGFHSQAFVLAVPVLYACTAMGAMVYHTLRHDPEQVRLAVGLPLARARCSDLPMSCC